jgi:sugar phosphate permease
MIQMNVLGRPRRVFYGWVVVAAGAANQALISGLGSHGFGTFIVPLEAQFGWSKATLSVARAFVQIENGLLGPLEGIVVDRFGPRVTMGVGLFFFGLGMVFLGMIQSLWAYYLSFVVIAFGASIGGHLVTTTVINNWFRRKRTLAMSLALTGVGLGGVIVVPILVWVHGAFGWREAAIGGGITVWIAAIPIVVAMRRAPEQYGALPDGDDPDRVREEEAARTRPRGGGDIDFTLGEAMRTSAFWFLGLSHGMALLPPVAVGVHQFAHMEQGVGLAAAAAALVVTVMSAFVIVGRLIGGVLGDRWDKRYVYVIGVAGAATGLAIFALATVLWQAMLYAVLFGLSWGMRGPTINSMRGEYFGRTSFGKIAGTSNLILMAFAISGPIFAGLMADILGNYKLAFLILAGMSVFGILTVLSIRPPPLPPRLAKQAGQQRISSS